MGIDLGRGNIGMTQQFLDASQIGTVIQEVGGEGVAQHMRCLLYTSDAADE